MNTADVSKPSGLLANLPLLLAIALLSFLLLDRVHGNTHMLWAFAGVAGGLIVWFAALKVSGRAMAIDAVKPIKQHYIQASVQIVLYSYWGYMWHVGDERPMFQQAPLILAQFCYLYAFDALWSWTRGRSWRFSSGPAPIVLSTNLFIWFVDDWFVFQFAMISLGLLGKEWIRWTKDGRRTHIFNPSGFGLACAATVLIATGATDLTWAKPLSTTIDVPYVFVVLFVLGLVVQHFFAVTLMTFAAALAMIGSNLAYTEITGVYLFASSNLPAAAFLGLLLLMTDPSTSPRTNVGRAIFGLGYGFGYVIAFQVLGKMGAPELYAKLYPVPILNCTVQLLDRLAMRGWIGRLNDRWQHQIPLKKSNAVHMLLWSGVFAVMLFTGYVPLDHSQRHPGDSIAFWKQAVAEGRHDAVRKLVMVAGSQAVAGNSADAYNELGILSMTEAVDSSSDEARRRSAVKWFGRAADLGHVAGNQNLLMMFLFYSLRRSDQDLQRAFALCDRLVREQQDATAACLLGLALEKGTGVDPSPKDALALYARCGADNLFASKGKARLGLQRGSLLRLDGVASKLRLAAKAGDGEACYYLAYMHLLGRGATKDAELAKTWLQRAVALGFAPAVEASRQESMPSFVAPLRRFLQHPDWVSGIPAKA